MTKVLFVCLGNICRSPMAEGLFIHQVEAAGLAAQFEVDSCGTSGWHAGERPDRRMLQTAKKHGVDLPSRSRQIRHSDFMEYDYILAMDQQNLRDLQQLEAQNPNAQAKLFKMREFDPQAPNADVPDPYWGGDNGFEEVYHMLDRSSQHLLEFIRKEQGI